MIVPLTPLGMDRSNLSVDDMRADPDHASAYERRQGVIVPVPPRPVTAMARVGAVNSCAADMARWLLAQLAEGSKMAGPSCHPTRWPASTRPTC